MVHMTPSATASARQGSSTNELICTIFGCRNTIEWQKLMLVTFLQAVAACNASVPRVCTLHFMQCLYALSLRLVSVVVGTAIPTSL